MKNINIPLLFVLLLSTNEAYPLAWASNLSSPGNDVKGVLFIKLNHDDEYDPAEYAAEMIGVEFHPPPNPPTQEFSVRIPTTGNLALWRLEYPTESSSVTVTISSEEDCDINMYGWWSGTVFYGDDPPPDLEYEHEDEYFPPCSSPIVIDMKQDGIDLGPPGEFVLFDVNGDGIHEIIQWVRRGGDEEFLALDLNENGEIDSRQELFGHATEFIGTEETATHGFEALAQYDDASLGGNEDGEITRSDRIWDRLLLWNDVNADGMSTATELRPLNQSVLQVLSTTAKASRRTDAAGNEFRYWAWALNDSRRGNRKHRMVDVFFAAGPE